MSPSLSLQGLGSEQSQRTHATGAQQNHVNTTTNENTSIYVAGLAPDLTEKDLGNNFLTAHSHGFITYFFLLFKCNNYYVCVLSKMLNRNTLLSQW